MAVDARLVTLFSCYRDAELRSAPSLPKLVQRMELKERATFGFSLADAAAS